VSDYVPDQRPLRRHPLLCFVAAIVITLGLLWLNNQVRLPPSLLQ